MKEVVKMQAWIILMIMVWKCHAKIPALLVFGDSTLDAGNNNYFNTTARANFPPYGKDFPGGKQTGRFSNGKLVSDFLASALGIKEAVPAYLDPSLTAKDLLTGVTFASAGCGLDTLTSETDNSLNLNRQLQYFKQYRTRITKIAGDTESNRIIRDSIYFLSAGAVDFALSYYYFNRPGKRYAQFTLPKYIDYLINQANLFITNLHGMGARKFLVAGLPPLGCTPLERTALGYPWRSCNVEISNTAYKFNQRFQPALGDLEKSLSGSRIVYSNNYDINVDVMTNPLNHGFVEVTRACCGSGLFEMGTTCRDAGFTCPDADRFIYWDGSHPSQRMYGIVADLIIKRDLPNLL